MADCSKYTKKNIGKVFPFTIAKVIQLPNENQQYYLITDTKNCKFTIPTLPYLQYNYSIGQEVACKLDQINCDGKIFFEPENPVYKENKTYKFEFLRKETITNYLGISEEIAIVKDEFALEQWIRYATSISIKDKMTTAWVEKIKKGRLFLLPENNNDNLLMPGNIYDFKIINTINTDRFGEVYVITDKSGNKHTIPKKYYKGYNLESQHWFKATIKRFSSKGFFYIEPEHPFYKLNNTYSFKILDKINDQKSTTYFTEDKLGKVASFTVSIRSLKINSEALCKVTGFKKGTPLLKYIKE